MGVSTGAATATYRVVLEYDGAGFSGWQIQRARRSVQGAIAAALGVLTRGEPIVPIGAGRTDAGVHAEGQVASFRSEVELDLSRLVRALPALAGRDLAVIEAARAPDHFDARRLARARTYRYRILDEPSPLWRRWAWYPRARLDADAMAEAGDVLRGRHDMTSFAARTDDSHSKLCEVTDLSWRRWERGLELEITADRFLHHMVRNVVGTLVSVGAGRTSAQAMAEIVEARDRRAAGPTAPARGLTLVRVSYRSEDVATPPRSVC